MPERKRSSTGSTIESDAPFLACYAQKKELMRMRRSAIRPALKPPSIFMKKRIHPEANGACHVGDGDAHIHFPNNTQMKYGEAGRLENSPELGQQLSVTSPRF
jgi:hypothetical protein